MFNYYEVLQIPPKAAQEEIRRAYREHALRCHPDRGGSHETMVLVNEAWEFLSDAERRSEYDRVRAQQHDHSAQESWQENTAGIRQRAREYPRQWEAFQAWATAFASDVLVTCPTCHHTFNYTPTAAKGPSVCPRCHWSHAWDGTRCRHCGYPAPPKTPPKTGRSEAKRRIVALLVGAVLGLVVAESALPFVLFKTMFTSFSEHIDKVSNKQLTEELARHPDFNPDQKAQFIEGWESASNEAKVKVLEELSGKSGRELVAASPWFALFYLLGAAGGMGVAYAVAWRARKTL